MGSSNLGATKERQNTSPTSITTHLLYSIALSIPTQAPNSTTSLFVERNSLSRYVYEMWASSLRSISNPSVRTRRLATSTFFIATFVASILTVSLSASTILPCPANTRSKYRGAYTEDQEHMQERHNIRQAAAAEQMPANGVGQKILLTRKGGWIEIEQPSIPLPN